MLLFGVASAADLEGAPTFGQFPGTAGLLTRPSRLGWESAPLVAVGASLGGAPELDLSSRRLRTVAFALALPASLDHDESQFGGTEAPVTRSWSGSLSPWLGAGIAGRGDDTAWGASVVADLALAVAPAELSGGEVVWTTPSGTIEWSDGRPTRGDGTAGHGTGQDLDVAATFGTAALDGPVRHRVDVLARHLRSGEWVRAAEGVGIATTTPTTTFGTPEPASYSVDSVEGASPEPRWGYPNRSAATLGAVFGADTGGTVDDPAARWEVGLEGGPTWPTFRETLRVDDRYTPTAARTRTTREGVGTRAAAHVGGTWGWRSEAADGSTPVRVRAGWVVTGLRELLEVEVCTPRATPRCEMRSDLVRYGTLTFPAAASLRWGPHVRALAGLDPYAWVYEYALSVDHDGVPNDRLVDLAAGVGFAARGGLTYTRDGWTLGASLAGSTGAVGGLGGYGGTGFSTPSLPSYSPPLRPGDLTPGNGPLLSIQPSLWLGWRPER